MPLRLACFSLFVLGCATGCENRSSGANLDARAGRADAMGPDGRTDPNSDANAGEQPPGEPTTVRFLAFGDFGKRNEGQLRAAAAMRSVCAAYGCDFAVLLGDNIYNAGVRSIDDELWQSTFEMPYRDLDFPFYAALGNHDYGGRLLGLDAGGIGNEWDKGLHEVAYTQRSQRWKMPATHYTFAKGPVGFIALDTNAALWSNTEHGDQAAWLPSAVAQIADRPWKIVFGHHPYLSNGKHGNAGSYDAPELGGFNLPNPLPIQNGRAFKRFMDDHVCGIGDVYLAGHDHARMWLNEPGKLCGMEMIVSGAAASPEALQDRGNAMHYEDGTKVGFLHVEVTATSFKGRFFDADGNLDFEREVRR